MHIVGISTPGRSSAVALLDEKSILFCIEEEKLSRLQEPTDVPRLALERCLQETHLKLSDCRGIAVAERFASAHASRKRASRSVDDERLAGLLRGGPRPTRFDHPLCHAASAYYASGF